MEHLLSALPLVLQWHNILAMVIGTIGGIAIGALPGLTATMGVAILLPLTFTLEPLTALAMVSGIYNGAMFGGAIPAILLRIPGTPSAIATTFDGYPMMQKGEAGKALEIAVTSSAVGGMVSALALMLFAPPLVLVALAFGPAEYFWVAVFGLVSIAVLLGDSVIKGLLSVCLGLFLGTVGVDQITGVERFTFDSMHLVGGFEIVVLLTGLYAIPPALIMAEDAIRQSPPQVAQALLQRSTRLLSLCRTLWRTWTRASIIGVVIGIIPGAGGNVASFLSWNEEKRTAKDPTRFGDGAPEGLAASECANNADNAAALIPALTLGVPGNAVAAVILGALLIHGLRPGPELFTQSADVAYGFMLELFITSVMVFFLGRYGAPLFVHVLRAPKPLLVPMIISLAVIGAYSLRNSIFDIWAVFGFGLLGYAMERLRIPLAPAVIALILGPMAESELRRALIIGQGDVAALFSGPISIILVVLSVAVFASPVIRRVVAKRRQPET
ncbi:MAG: tripartite tricarboxylate transporter permease [Hyphomicrobiales bacterium]|nr:tripartite tricarboxylate transporter permease [Hyphomicrobiales bacterium]